MCISFCIIWVSKICDWLHTRSRRLVHCCSCRFLDDGQWFWIWSGQLGKQASRPNKGQWWKSKTVGWNSLIYIYIYVYIHISSRGRFTSIFAAAARSAHWSLAKDTLTHGYPKGVNMLLTKHTCITPILIYHIFTKRHLQLRHSTTAARILLTSHRHIFMAEFQPTHALHTVARFAFSSLLSYPFSSFCCFHQWKLDM